MAMIVGKSTGYLAVLREKLQFLRGNFRLIVAWPVAALILGVVGWSVLFAKINEDRRNVENFALRESAALSRSYASHLNRAIEGVDQFLNHIRFEWELSNGRLRLENIQRKGLLPDYSYFNILIADRNGRPITMGVPSKVPLNAIDRQYFMIHKADDKDILYIGPPLTSRLTGKQIIPFSRKLVAPDGSFDGIVLITVTPEYFTSNYDETTLGENGFLGIAVDDDILLTRSGNVIYPPGAPLIRGIPHFSQDGGSAFFNGKSWFTDKRNRYVGWRMVPKYSMLAMIGLDQEASFAQFQENRTLLIRVATLATLGLALFTLIAVTLSMRLAWRKYQLESTQAAYRMATEGGKEGFYIARPIRGDSGAIMDFEILDTNRPGADFLRHRPEDLIGKRLTTLYERADPECLMEILRMALETNFYEGDLEVPPNSPFALRWAHFHVVRSGGDLAITLRDISDVKAHVEELERRGNEDALTALPNRHWVHSYLPQSIERAAASQSMLALLFIDLDGFKKVNDTMGHPVGDELLRNAALRLKDAVRPHDHVVRLGGDEFLVIIENILQQGDAAHVAQRVLQAFQEGFKLSQGMHLIGTSIGIAMFPSDGTDADTLLRHADIAMYSVKTSGKGHYRFYDQKFYDALRTRVERESELRHAIQHDQFVMYYQPRVDTFTGITSSMEALVRWMHPVKGLREPQEFIPLAEETGLILDLGELIIDKVCAQLASWADKSEELVPVSINVSPRQFNEADISAVLSAAIARHGIDPSLVEIELTESSMMGDSPDISSTLTSIRQMGVRLLVDDFGTGYSSLSQLQRLDFDVLKVDRAFTAEIERSEKGNVFFKAIITMAHALGMRVVAEGVENERQIRILKSLRCDEIQGYYISRPIPPTRAQPILPKWFFPSTT